jgi:hypothetical protein
MAGKNDSGDKPQKTVPDEPGENVTGQQDEPEEH